MLTLNSTHRPTLNELFAKSKSHGAAALLQVELEDLDRMISEAQKALDVEDDSTDFECPNGLN